MLQVDEVTSDWSVLLAMSDMETVRLLAVILDGFGYTPLECRSHEAVYDHLSRTTPFAAVVDLDLDDAERICQLVSERGGVALVILLADNEENPEEKIERLKAEAWESSDAGPEKILSTLRSLANGEGSAS